MGWNGSGTFNRIYSWVADKAAGFDISSSRMDTDTDDIASAGFGNCLTRDGQGQPTTTLPMAGFRHTNVGTGVARSDYAALGQVQDGSTNWTVAGGSSDAITATYTPALTVLVDGQLCWFRATAANTTTTPTFSPNSLTARTITLRGGGSLAPGSIPGNLAECILRYNSANTRWELLNPSQATTRQVLTSGTSATYTTPSGAIQLKIRMVGGGGGGGGTASDGTGSNGLSGGNSSFNSIVANGGAGGTASNSGGYSTGGAGGSGGSGSASVRINGSIGQFGSNKNTAGNTFGGSGGTSVFGGSGAIVSNAAAGSNASIGGSGGSGGSCNGNGNIGTGGGGGAGEYVELIINNPSATYIYSVGAAGGSGANGTGGQSGGNGGGGLIIVDEYYG